MGNSKMNKLLLICLAGAALVALSGAEVSSEEQSVAELSQLREVRAADPGKGNGNGKSKGNGHGKGKGKGKNLKNKGKKNKKGRHLTKSDKKGAGKKKGDKKKKGRKNGAQKGKKNGKKNGKGKNRKNGAKKNNKKQKGLKKSRKNKANGAGKNKNKKKARKAAKKADKKEKKKARKQEKKEQKKSRKNNHGNRVNIGRSSCMNATCIDNAVTYMKQLKLAVKNFGKQYNRISTNAKQSSGTSSKYDEFAPYLIKLRETGGGNASNLTCNGEKNQGATNLKTLYDNLATCETIINSTRNTGMPDVNMTFLDACKATMDNFTAKANEAIKLTGADACLIWESAELAEMSTMLKGCSIKSLESEQTAAKKACTGNFSYCRQEEDKVSKIVSACSASNSADKVAAAVAQGVKNQAAATAVSKKVNETLAASRSASPRSTDITCANFAVEVTSVSTQVTNAPLLASLATMLTTIVAYTVGECSTDDVTSLGTASTTFLESTETITVAIAEKQAALNISTGTTLSVAGSSAITIPTTS